MVILKDDSYDVFIEGMWLFLKNPVLVVIVHTFFSVLTSLFPWYWPFKLCASESFTL